MVHKPCCITYSRYEVELGNQQCWVIVRFEKMLIFIIAFSIK